MLEEEMGFSEFNMTNLSSLSQDKKIVSCGYSATTGKKFNLELGEIEEDVFIVFSKIGDEKNLRKRINQQDSGYKFHIAIDDDSTAPDNLSKALNIVLPILIKKGVKVFKVVNPNYRYDLYQDEFQHAKQITVYQYKQIKEPPKYWKDLIEEITMALSNSNIVPGEVCTEWDRKDTPIKGSSYIGFRCEGKNFYILHEKKTNPFDEIDLGHINQPKCKKWEKQEPFVEKKFYL